MTGTDAQDRAGDDGTVAVDEQTERDDWAWRRRIRANPHSRRIYRIAVAIAGLVVVLGGLALVPLPGPGWVIVFGGLAIWATEFEWAQALLQWAKRVLSTWNEWMKRQALVGQPPRRAGHPRPGTRPLLRLLRTDRRAVPDARRPTELA